MGSGGGGTTTTETKSNSHLPAFEQPAAKGYLSALMGEVFPGMTMPSNFIPKGWDLNPSASAAGGVDGSLGAWDTTAHADNAKWMKNHPKKAAQIQAQLAAQAAAPAQGAAPGSAGNQIPTQPINSSTAYNTLNPMIAGSPYLQNLYAQNPGSISSALSPAAANQLSSIYGNMGLG